MGRAGRPKSDTVGHLRSASAREVLAQEGMGSVVDGPAADAIEEGGLLPGDYEVSVLEVDYQTHRWSVQDPQGGSISGLADTASAARRDAEAYTEKKASERRAQVIERQKIFEERKRMLGGLNLPDHIGSMRTDILSDPRVEHLEREPLTRRPGERFEILTYKRDRKHNRSPYPVIASGKPQKQSGYLVFMDGEPLPLGDNSSGPLPEQPRGMWLGSWRRHLRLQAQKEVEAYVAREEAIRQAADEDFLRREAEDIFRNRPDERMS